MPECSWIKTRNIRHWFWNSRIWDKEKWDNYCNDEDVSPDDIAEKIKEARSHGDLSENAEYDEAMNEQAKMEAEIAKLEADLRNATILDEEELTNEFVRIGSKVKLYDMDFEEEVEYKILGKSDLDNNIISNNHFFICVVLNDKTYIIR